MPAWLLWLLVHLFYLIGFQNRLLVVLRWTFSFLTRGRGARLIVETAERNNARGESCGRRALRPPRMPRAAHVPKAFIGHQVGI